MSVEQTNATMGRQAADLPIAQREDDKPWLVILRCRNRNEVAYAKANPKEYKVGNNTK